jgi:hypothetical protein
MSRTYRRKSGDHTDLFWQTKTMVRVPDRYIWLWVPMDPKSKEYIKIVRKYHSDAGTHSCGNGKAPPGWFITQHVQRPHRRDANRQLRKWLLDPEYELILNAKDPLPYWD